MKRKKLFRPNKSGGFPCLSAAEHVSNGCHGKWRRRWDSNPRDLHSPAVLKTAAFDRSATPPKALTKARFCSRVSNRSRNGPFCYRARQAAREPELFRDLAERFPGRMPAEDVLRNYLIRNGFAPAAVSSVILAYRETCEFAEREAGAYDSGPVPVSTEAPAMHSTPQSHSTAPAPNTGKPVYNQSDERNVARYDFEGGGFVRISVGGPIETEQALSMAETLIGLKRAEIEARNERARNTLPSDANSSDESEYDA